MKETKITVSPFLYQASPALLQESISGREMWKTLNNDLTLTDSHKADLARLLS